MRMGPDLESWRWDFASRGSSSQSLWINRCASLILPNALASPCRLLTRPEMTAGPNELERKTPSTFSFFIYGASTSVGLYAAQLVRRSAESSGSNVKLFGTAGEKHFKMLKAEPYGYDDLVDYHEED